MSSSRCPQGWRCLSLGQVTREEDRRVGRGESSQPRVMSSTKHYGLVPSDEYFKNRQIYSGDLSNYRSLEKGWFAYATNHLTEGSIGLYRDVAPACVSPIYSVFSCRNGVDPEYLFRVVKSPRVLNSYREHDQASVDRRGAVRYRDFAKIVVDLPPLPEQRRIAEILDTLDEAIRKTEQVIAKLQQMKQGLLHDLLTRGIDENGELRDPERHPEQFKGSPLGRIPRGWEVETVQQLLADVDPAMRSGPFGSALLKDELVSKGVPLLGIDNVHVERFVRHFTRFVTPQKAVELGRYRVRPGDVMITIMGTVGRCALVPDDIGEALSSKHVWTLTLDRTRYSPHLACLQFNHAPWVLTHFGRDEQGGIMSAIRSDTLRTALLPVPPPAEQGRIVAVLAELDQRLTGESSDADKLRTLKHGLMHDLLTGRVRTLPSEATA